MERKDRTLKLLSDGREAWRDHEGNIFVRDGEWLRQLRGAELANAECDFDGWSQNPEAHAAFKRAFG